MRAKLVHESFLNEEVIGKFPGKWGAGQISIFKNPPFIKRMSPWIRAFTDQYGNFYVGDEENPADEDRIGTTHTDLMSHVQDIDRTIQTRWYGPKGIYTAGIGWQRAGKTNMFYLSESYADAKNEKEMLDEVSKIMRLSNFYKPKDAKFVTEIINTQYDYDKGKPRHDYIPEL